MIWYTCYKKNEELPFAMFQVEGEANLFLRKLYSGFSGDVRVVTEQTQDVTFEEQNMVNKALDLLYEKEKDEKILKFKERMQLAMIPIQ